MSEGSETVSSSTELDAHFSLTKTTERFSRVMRTVATDYEVSFTGLSHIADRLEELFERVVFKIIERAGANTSSENRRVRFVLSNTALDFPISIPFTTVADMSAQRIVSEIQRVLNSNQSFQLSEGLRVNFICVSLPEMGSSTKCGSIALRKIPTLNNWKASKKSIITVKVDKNHCLIAAVAIGRELTERVKNKRSSIKLSKQTTLLNILFEDFKRKDCQMWSAIKLGNKMMSVDHLVEIGKCMPEYNITLYDACFFGKVVYSVNQESNKHIDLLYDSSAKHVDVITSMTGLFQVRYYCYSCHKGYKTQVHRCSKSQCVLCHHPKCLNQVLYVPPESTKLCTTCFLQLKTLECSQCHLQNRVCDSIRCCRVCNVTWKKGSRKHCCDSIVCTICSEKYLKSSITHKCFISRPRKRGSPDALGEGVAKIKCIKVDQSDTASINAVTSNELESSVNDRHIFAFDIETDQSSGTHKPNLLVMEALSPLHSDPIIFKGYDCIDSFCTYVFGSLVSSKKEEWFFAHYGSGFDFHPLIEWLYQYGRYLPEIILRGSKIISLTVGRKRFFDSYLFIPIPLASFSKTFNIKEHKKGYFPHLMSNSDNQDFSGKPGEFPSKDLFGCDKMNDRRFREFSEWYDQQVAIYKSTKSVYNFANELISYCISDVRVLKHGILTFRSLIHKITGVNPFQVAITAASACNYIYRAKFMPEKSIAILPRNGSYVPADTQSVSALAWLSWQESKIGVSMYRSGGKLGGEKKVGPFKVDGYVEEFADDGVTKLVRIFEFFGCYYHGCSKCYNPLTLNTLQKQCMGQLYGVALYRIEWFKSNGFDLTYIWECEFRELLKNEPELANFYKGYQKPLSPRDAFFGGRTENFKTFWKATSEYERLEYADICSLYPFVNATCEYPIGHPDSVLLDKFGDLATVSVRYFGLIKCRILPPRALLIPVLPLRFEGKLFFPLCYACVQLSLSSQCSHVDVCKHSDDERAFWGTFCTPELDLSVKKGYSILKVSEVWHWEEEHRSKTLFREYINTFLKIKTESSGWPSHCVDEDSKTSYLRAYNEKEGIKLDREKIEKNEGLRFISKLLLNSFWGYLGMRDNMKKTKYLNTYNDLVKEFQSDTSNVTDLCLVGEDMVLLQSEAIDEEIPQSLKTNVVLASFTTSHARIVLYGYMDKIDPSRICYCDTDSIMYYRNTLTSDSTIPLGDYLGDMTDEIPQDVQVTEFYCAGPKFYLLTGTNEVSGKAFECFKVKGLSINQNTKQHINSDSIKKLIRNEITEIRAPFSFIAGNKNTGLLTNKSCNKLSRVTSIKRVFNKQSGNSIPYGFSLID